MNVVIQSKLDQPAKASRFRSVTGTTNQSPKIDKEPGPAANILCIIFGAI
jgi:hypothetical protein